MLGLILLIVAAVLCGLAAFGVAAPRVHLGWLGVALAIVAFLVDGLPG